MVQSPDFIVSYDPSVDSQRDVGIRILNSIVVKRLRARKPVIWFIGGDSGEGKSLSSISVEDILLGLQGIDLVDVLDAVNVFTPLEYPEKMDAILHDKRLKKVNVIAIQEARDLVRSSSWHSFLSQTVADVNTQSRALKPMCILLLSQFIRDVTTDVRYSFSFYSTVKRQNNTWSPATLYISKMWKDDRDLEKPKLRRANFKGFLRLPNGKYRRYVFTGFELPKPRKELVEMFDKLDVAAKSIITRNKLNDLMSRMRLEFGLTSDKVGAVVDKFVSNPDSIGLIGRRVRGKWRLNSDAAVMFGFSRDEVRSFEDRFSKALVAKDL